MALNIPAIVHAAVATANRLTKSTQPTIKHRMTIGVDVEGPLLQTPEQAVTREGIVEDMGEEVMSETGIEALATSKITFLEPVPIQLSDLFILPDGTTGNIIRRGGLLDGDGQPYYREVFVGRTGR